MPANHSQEPESSPAPAPEGRLRWALILTAGFMVAEVAGGLISGSLALLADAGHMLTDAASLGLALAAARLSRRSPDQARTYGYYRAQVLAAFVNGLSLLAISAWVLWEAFQRLLEPTPVLGGLMLGVALAGLAVNLIALWVLRGGDPANLNLKGALLHVMGDLLGSLAALLAAAVILATGWYPADPLLSILVALLIIASGWRIVKKSAHVLMEGAPSDFDPQALRQGLRDALPQVLDVHHVHAWSLAPDQPPLVTLHLDAAPGADPDQVLRQAQEHLRRQGIPHATIQVETRACVADGGCAVSTGPQNDEPGP